VAVFPKESRAVFVRLTAAPAAGITVEAVMLILTAEPESAVTVTVALAIEPSVTLIAAAAAL
jgi:hypothetical protein